MDLNTAEHEILFYALELLIEEYTGRHKRVLSEFGEDDEFLRKQFVEQFALYKKLGGTRKFALSEPRPATNSSFASLGEVWGR